MARHVHHTGMDRTGTEASQTNDKHTYVQTKPRAKIDRSMQRSISIKLRQDSPLRPSRRDASVVRRKQIEIPPFKSGRANERADRRLTCGRASGVLSDERSGAPFPERGARGIQTRTPRRARRPPRPAAARSPGRAVEPATAWLADCLAGSRRPDGRQAGRGPRSGSRRCARGGSAAPARQARMEYPIDGFPCASAAAGWALSHPPARSLARALARVRGRFRLVRGGTRTALGRWVGRPRCRRAY